MWGVLIGTAYVVRVRLAASLGVSLAAVALCYVALALTALRIVGFDASGALAATGMLVPLAVSAALVTWRS